MFFTSENKIYIGIFRMGLGSDDGVHNSLVLISFYSLRFLSVFLSGIELWPRFHKTEPRTSVRDGENERERERVCVWGGAMLKNWAHINEFTAGAVQSSSGGWPHNWGMCVCECKRERERERQCFSTNVGSLLHLGGKWKSHTNKHD